MNGDLNFRIASRVRSLRSERKLSLDALADKTGVSRSMLSLIERGETSPTAVVLDKVAAGLGVALASLFEDKSAPPVPIRRSREQSEWRDPQTGYIRRNLSPPSFPSPIQMVKVELPPKANVVYETGARDISISQQVWVMKGTIEITIGNTVHRLQEGDCLAMQLGKPMAFRNKTGKAAEYVVVLASDKWQPALA